jgi:hypothetical protein
MRTHFPKQDFETVEISPDLLQRLEALPEASTSRARRWTPEEDKALLLYWPVKRHCEVAKALGVAESTARQRYRELTNEGD